MLREPAVAGQFYGSEPEKLSAELDDLIPVRGSGSFFYGALVPHAGYMYSGKTAGAVYAKIALPPAVILLGPNHTGMGSPGAVWARGAWKTPLGDVGVDSFLAGKLIDDSFLFREDYDAHLTEHSLEVQLPFLKYLRNDIKIVPISLGAFSYGDCERAAESISSVLSENPMRAAVIASSDMSHYEPEKTARKKDSAAIDAMLAMDARSLYDSVRNQNISMCGYIPAVILIQAVKTLGSSKAELIEYTTSARASGDFSSVVGYCGMVFS